MEDTQRRHSQKPPGDDRVAVYTAVFGAYDDPPVVRQPDPALTYVLLTEDVAMQVPSPWQVMVVDRVFDDPQRDARRVKLLPHLFLGEFDISVWVDANCDLLALDLQTIHNLLGDADVAVCPHHSRRCLYDEARAVQELLMDSPELIERQMALYRGSEFPENFGLHGTMFLVRRLDTLLGRQFCHEWWTEVSRHSKRDQLSFDFVRWKSRARVQTLDLSHVDNPVFRWSGKHKVPRIPYSQSGNGQSASLPLPAPSGQPVAASPHPKARGLEASLVEQARSQLATQGYAEPIKLFSVQECQWLLKGLEVKGAPPAEWFKGNAVNHRAFYDAATDWRIMSRVIAAIGEHVVLWGAWLVNREPGEKHPWHSDIESSAPQGKTVSVWIGMRGTCAETSLKMAPGSHLFGITVQEKASQKGRRRQDICDEDIGAWTEECGAAEAPRLVPMQDGEALFFDGRIWHGSNNLSPELRRTALLLQYASVDTPIRMPVPYQCEWPFQMLERPLPPCLLVKGVDRVQVNRIVPSPPLPYATGERRLHSTVASADPSSLKGIVSPGWKAHILFEGTTHGLADVRSHVSLLQPGRCPHPPVQHPEEEFKLMLKGEVEAYFPDLRHEPDGGRRRLRPGDITYTPAGFYHTVSSVGPEPARYMMCKWIADPSGATPSLGFAQVTVPPSGGEDAVKGDGCWHKTVLFEGPTACLSKLRCHVTTVEPGGGHAPRVDSYDIMIVVLEGEVLSLGQRMGKDGVLFCAAGIPHGMENVGTVPARYLVLELHGGRMTTRLLREEGVTGSA
ncbi:cupin domain-containing protein [Roseimicrobium gellanilyticum]|nr:cupin domain-containing protein [Roseimicrobium gellanilyticum]